MAETTKKLFRFFDAEGNAASIKSEDVFDKTSGKTLAEFMTAAPSTESIQGQIDTAIEAVKTGDIATLQSSLSSLSTTVNNFLTGEPDDDTIDRLSELVNAINENKDSIDALVADHVKKSEIVNDLTTGGADKVLSAEQGKALKALIDALDATFDEANHSHANKDVLDAISKAGSGNLVFNGKELTGETGIAFGDSIENATAYTGKLRVVVEDYTVPGV